MKLFGRKKHHHIVKQILCVDKVSDDKDVQALQNKLDSRGYDVLVTKLPIMGMWTSDSTQSFQDQQCEDES